MANNCSVVLGALSKSIATIVTQPLIVAKVGLQSKPPAARNGKPFKSFVEVMEFIVKNEGALSLFKGIGPQLLKGFLVQGILMMTKERYVKKNHPRYSLQRNTDMLHYSVELMFILFMRFLSKLRSQQLGKAAALAAAAKVTSPVIAK